MYLSILVHRRGSEHGGQGEVRGHGADAVLCAVRGVVLSTHNTVQEGTSLLHGLQSQQQDLQGLQADDGRLPQLCLWQAAVIHRPPLQVWVSWLSYFNCGYKPTNSMPGPEAVQNCSSLTKSLNIKLCVASGLFLVRTRTKGVWLYFHTRYAMLYAVCHTDWWLHAPAHVQSVILMTHFSFLLFLSSCHSVMAPQANSCHGPIFVYIDLARWKLKGLDLGICPKVDKIGFYVFDVLETQNHDI